MGTKTHTKATKRPRFAMRLLAEDETHLRELQAAMATDADAPSYASIVRLALRELHTHRAAQRGQKGETP